MAKKRVPKCVEGAMQPCSHLLYIRFILLVLEGKKYKNEELGRDANKGLWYCVHSNAYNIAIK